MASHGIPLTALFLLGAIALEILGGLLLVAARSAGPSVLRSLTVDADEPAYA
jgi:hypothetical protein